MKPRHRSGSGTALFYLVPPLLWMGVIFFLSTDYGSAAHTGPLIHGLLYRLFAHSLGPELVDRINWDVRKTAHVMVYTVLGVLVFRAVRWGNPNFRGRYILLTFVIGTLYAASDEYHQSFVPSRGASIEDVFKDSYGVLVGIVFSLWGWFARLNRKASGR